MATNGPKRPKMIQRLTLVASYAQADADAMMDDQRKTAIDLHAAATFLRANAVPCVAGPALLAMLKRVLADYDDTYDELTDGQNGKPNSHTYKAARRLVRRLERPA